MTTPFSVMAFNLRLVGLMMIALVFVNLLVPRRFRWREELAGVSLLNRQIFQVHGMFIVLTLALFAVLLLTSSDALLVPSPLSRAVLAGLTIFWGARMLAQWFVYSPDIWRGNRFRTVMHYVFSVTWIYVTVTFAAALWMISRAL
jgi:hypothetical protein